MVFVVELYIAKKYTNYFKGELMKKMPLRLLICAFLLTFSTSIYADTYNFSDCYSTDCCGTSCIPCNSFKIRGAAFYPQGSLTRRIYDNWWPEGSLEYNNIGDRCWSPFLNVAYTYKNGRSVGSAGGDKTSINLIPMTVGINFWLRNFSCWRPYIGAGIGAAYVHMHDESPYVKRNINQWGFASLVQVGTEFDIVEWMFFDVFVGYRWNWFDFNRHRSNAETGGLNIGGGIGLRF